MNKYLKYIAYLITHKYYVAIECVKSKLWVLAITHDLSKFRLDEFIPYSKFFYGDGNKAVRDETGYFKPTDTGDDKFDFAWLLHQKRNKHHWQWWILPEDNGGLNVLEMPVKYRLEMLCDWVGAGKAQGRHSPKNDKFRETRKWYVANKNKMLFGVNTRQWIEEKIGYKEISK